MKSGLYKNIPFVRTGKDFIIFSPYSLNMTRINEKEFKSSDLESYLGNLGFFQQKEYNFSENMKIKKIGFTLTTDCNLNCKHCYANAGENPSYMSTELALKIIDTVVHSKIDYLLISFFGGEPTLNMKAIKAIIDHTKIFNIPTHYHITTNGVISNRHLDYIIQNGMDVSVSMDGLAEINDFIRPTKRGFGTSRSIERTIKRLVKSNILFQVRATISELNIDEIGNFVNYCADLGVKFIHFEPLSIDGRAKKYSLQLPSPEYFVEKFKQALDYATRRQIMIISSFYMNLLSPSKYFCTSLHGEKLLFNPDGSVSLCYKYQSQGDKFNKFIIGSFDLKNSILCLNETTRKNLRKLSICSFKKCNDCFAKFICAGGCPQRNFLSTEKLNEPDPWACEVKKELISDAIIRLHKDSRKCKESIILGSYIYESMIFNLLRKKEDAMTNKNKREIIKKGEKMDGKLVPLFLKESEDLKNQPKKRAFIKIERSESCF